MSTHTLQNTFALFVMTFGTCQIRKASNVKHIHPDIIGVHQQIGSNDRCRKSSTVGDALIAVFGKPDLIEVAGNLRVPKRIGPLLVSTLPAFVLN
jgi:hypothetical protein